MLIYLSSNIYKQSVSNNSFDFNQIQNNSVLCAKIAKKLSADMPGMNSEDIYTSALLHDMGKIFFAQFDWDNYSQVYKCKNLTDSEYLKKEEDICGLNHCEIANMIAYSWNMPEIISEIATYHHKPEQSLKYSRECALIKLADMIVQNKYSNEKLNIDKKLIDVLEILNI
ncbi:MAG: HDOD domain-containing protein, partial [Romboutsia sp.]|nr:HDOD domain-containing protein [Romboutsia sp.]